MSEYTEKAREIFNSGCNCAQSSLVPFCDTLGLEEDIAMRLASSLGGGMGGMKEACGALTGTFLAMGLAKGYGKGCTKDDKAAHNQRIQQLANQFREQYGWINCRDLMQRNEVDGSAQAEARPCMKYVLTAVENLEAALKRA